ncbi:putative endonuclease lcl3 [Collariella sp. IMI 366227]|nr:putative endonuclease lcl3 [Collariella sp. IMI 366227]
MCYHRRLLFACSHYAWLNLTRPCVVEKSFSRGKTDVGCAVKWSHGFDTIRVQKDCPKCAATREDDSFRLSVIKDQIQALKEQLRLIKCVEGLEGQTSEDDQNGEGEDSSEVFTSLAGKRENTGDTFVDGSYLRRFPAPSHITPKFFRRRSLLGKVTSVGDGDGFHLFHTPGGRLAGWGWLRRVPTDRKQLKGQTISIRIAGVDAPEGAHFGHPAQPFASEALRHLEALVLGRRVRCYIYKRDQYERVVATVYVRQPPFFFPRKDVGLELLRAGLAVTYEGKTGAEFGGERMERRPMEYKKRMKLMDGAKGKV